MAYYTTDNYYETPYDGSHYYVAPSVDYSSHGFCNQSSFYGYNTNLVPQFGGYYDAATGCSFTGYNSISSFSDPKSVVYDPYGDGYSSSSVTQFRISYSVAGLDDLDFEEYDPTPYGGGYDITLTYGKPLPPSDATCYPPSSSTEPPSEKTKPDEIVIKQQDPKKEDEINKDDHKKPVEQPEVSQEKAGDDQNYGYDDDYEYKDEEKGRGVVVDWTPPPPPPPPGYGLETMDICEGLFGHWPCLDRYYRSCNNGGHGDREEIGNVNGSYGGDLWKESVDYFFGDSNPYGGERFDGGGSGYYGNTVYGYERL